MVFMGGFTGSFALVAPGSAPPTAASQLVQAATSATGTALLSSAASLGIMSPPRRAEVRLSAHVHTKVDSPHNPDFSALVRKVV